MSTTALTKVGSSALSKLKPHVIRWFLKKYFPIDIGKLVIEFNVYPNASLNHHTQEHNLWFEFELKNFGLYDLELINFDCTIRTEGHDIIRLKESVGYDLKSDGLYRFSTIHQLSIGDAARIKQFVPEKEFAPADFMFRFTIRSKFGIQDIYLPDKRYCLQIRQYHPPANIT